MNTSIGQRRTFWIAMAFLLPNLLGFLVFTAGPVVLSLFMSLTNWDLKPAVKLDFVGLGNYKELFSDPDFWFYLYNTFYFMLLIPVSVIASLVLANFLVDELLIKKVKVRLRLAGVMLLAGALPLIWCILFGSADAALMLAVLLATGIAAVVFGSNTYRTMLYIPSFTAGVATIILWTQIYNPNYGLANAILSEVYQWFGIVPGSDTLPQWLTSMKNLLGFLPLPENFNNQDAFGVGAREAIMIMGFWCGIGGNNMIMYIAAIANIPTSLYEAADIDGANAWNKFRHITVPSVAPTTFFISIMSVIGGLQGGFENARIMTGGGPAGTTTTLSYYIYVTGFENLRLGYASSVAWVLFAMIFVLTLINWKYGNRRLEM